MQPGFNLCALIREEIKISAVDHEVSDKRSRRPQLSILQGSEAPLSAGLFIASLGNILETNRPLRAT